jgi:GAF domain-containing protein
MSVTFSVMLDPAAPIRPRPEVPGIDAPDEAWDAWYEALEALDGPSVNVSNTNAAHLLALLGLTPAGTSTERPDPFDCGDLSGALPADEFLGRVLIALAVNPADAGIPSTSEGGPGTGTAEVIDCGRRPGYSDERLDQLRTLAEAARDAGREVVWS